MRSITSSQIVPIILDKCRKIIGIRKLELMAKNSKTEKENLEAKFGDIFILQYQKNIWC